MTDRQTDGRSVVVVVVLVSEEAASKQAGGGLSWINARMEKRDYQHTRACPLEVTMMEKQARDASTQERGMKQIVCTRCAVLCFALLCVGAWSAVAPAMDRGGREWP